MGRVLSLPHRAGSGRRYWQQLSAALCRRVAAEGRNRRESKTRRLRESTRGGGLRPIHRGASSVPASAAGIEGRGSARAGAAVEKTVAALENFAAKAARAGSRTRVGAATAAVRDAATGGELLMRIWETTGQSVPMITGDQEAELAFLGVPATDFGKQAAPPSDHRCRRGARPKSSSVTPPEGSSGERACPWAPCG